MFCEAQNCSLSSVDSDGQGRSYDLSPLALDTGNWEVQHSTGDTSKKMYINVCRSLVQMGGPCARVSSVFSTAPSVSPAFYLLRQARGRVLPVQRLV